MNQEKDEKSPGPDEPISESEKASPKPEQEEVKISRKEYEGILARLKELEGMQEKFLRAAADFDNAKKRLVRERDEFMRFSQENLIRHLLPVLDNFERAIAHAREEKGSNLKGLVSGIEMVFKQLAEILKNQGLKRLKAVGSKFDPHFHEAVGFQEEEGTDDEVLAEVEPGYLLHDKLLRAAKVRVRKSPSAARKVSASQEEKQEEIT
jgi:molecular chaperone GrpE